MLRTRRLPGLHFELQAPPPDDILPRMDIACFVGFAASGPLHLPVRVASVAQFEMIFGADLKLAWDTTRGEQVYAYLAPAVRAYFRNGGRLAWIIRVAGDAQTSYFPVLGLLEAKFDDRGNLLHMRPAFAGARSPGTWSESMRVSTSLLSGSITLEPVEYGPPRFIATLASASELSVGDLLRLTFENGTILMCTVQSIEPAQTPPFELNQYHVTCDHAIWFQSSWVHFPFEQTGFADSYQYDSENVGIPVAIPLQANSPITFDWPTQENPGPVKLDLDSINVPQPGSFLHVRLGDDSLWMRIDDIGATDLPGSPLMEGVRVSGPGFWHIATPAALGDRIDFVERLSFELWVHTDEEHFNKLSDLTFDPRHLRCWDNLPTDVKLYAETNQQQNDRLGLWSQVANPRFPLAGQQLKDVVFVPLAMSATPDHYLAPEVSADDRLTREGLQDFNQNLFLDRALSQTCIRDLLNEADFLRYQAPQPRRLRGIHAVLELDEVTMVVVPDAVHRGWVRREPEPLSNPEPSDPLQRPEWWHFKGCIPRADIPKTHEPERGNFLNCDIRVIEPPCFYPLEPDTAATFTLRWQSVEAQATYILEEATRSDFKDAIPIYEGLIDSITLYGHTPGVFYYRVRVVSGNQSSDWSDGLVIGIAAFQHWTLQETHEYSASALLEIQHAVLRLCAARGDLFALLALPEHYREADTLEHVRLLRTGSSGFCGPEEPRTLSYGAIYHPWLIGREESLPDEFRHTPPDGAMTGQMAYRAIRRGAWIATANEFLKGVVALTPSIQRSHWQEFQDAQINLIRHEPKGFTALNNDTLTSDEELRPINVRRLLILLRRLALKLGPTYVFEPNDAAFRRSVQRGFEAVLDELFRRGAFAGRTAETSYQVVTDASINTPQLVDQGRFTVELKVAPSLPLTFITIRLVQTGDRTLIMQEV
jgi:hypothetical protein